MLLAYIDKDLAGLGEGVVHKIVPVVKKATGHGRERGGAGAGGRGHKLSLDVFAREVQNEVPKAFEVITSVDNGVKRVCEGLKVAVLDDVIHDPLSGVGAIARSSVLTSGIVAGFGGGGSEESGAGAGFRQVLEDVRVGDSVAVVVADADSLTEGGEPDGVVPKGVQRVGDKGSL